MSFIEKQIIPIDLTVLEDIDEKFFKQIQMNGKKVMKKFPDLFEQTKQNAYEKLTCEGIMQSFAIEKIEDNTVYMEDGETIPSKIVARAFKESKEVAIFAVTLHGYEELDKGSDDMMEQFFYDGWGTALVENAYAWLRKKMKSDVAADGIYGTCSWSPGQHNVDIKLQKMLFRMIKPEEIGITLNQSCMMDPKKSVSGFLGLGYEKEVENIRACDFCEHRDTCPSAYTEQ